MTSRDSEAQAPGAGASAVDATRASAPPRGTQGAGSSRVTEGAPLVIRPRRIVYMGTIAAALVLATTIVLTVTLQADGISLRTVDKVGFASVGVFGAAAIMLVARPRIRADASGMSVRNVLGETMLPWPVVLKIAFHPGAHWAQAVLADDETIPMLAIQAMDHERAVVALRAIRALHAAYAPAAPKPTPEAAERARRREIAEVAAQSRRPLGRLEQIDRRMAELGPKPTRRERREAKRGAAR